jgi:hypothetical protein
MHFALRSAAGHMLLRFGPKAAQLQQTGDAAARTGTDEESCV